MHRENRVSPEGEKAHPVTHTLDELSYLRIRTAIQAKELFELRVAAAAQDIDTALRNAFTKAGLDPDKTYNLDVNSLTATEVIN